MPRYVVVAPMTLKPTYALSGSRLPRAVRVARTWHLAQIVGDVPSPVPVCGAPTIKPETTRAVRDWEIVPPRCAECENRVGEGAYVEFAS
jgi:hypothetical protein